MCACMCFICATVNFMHYAYYFYDSCMSISKIFSLAPDFKNVQKEVSEFIKGRVLIGHAIHHDLKVVLGTSWFTCIGYE